MWCNWYHLMGMIVIHTVASTGVRDVRNHGALVRVAVTNKLLNWIIRTKLFVMIYHWYSLIIKLVRQIWRTLKLKGNALHWPVPDICVGLMAFSQRTAYLRPILRLALQPSQSNYFKPITFYMTYMMQGVKRIDDYFKDNTMRWIITCILTYKRGRLFLYKRKTHVAETWMDG